jgi:hypothetical protein
MKTKLIIIGGFVVAVLVVLFLTQKGDDKTQIRPEVPASVGVGAPRPESATEISML